MFICEVTESVKLSDIETMTYTYYQNNVKPKPETDKKGWVCDICGYIYEGETCRKILSVRFVNMVQQISRSSNKAFVEDYWNRWIFLEYIVTADILQRRNL